MTDFQNTTQAIDDLISSQVHDDWANIPGGLVKASSCPAGSVWGFNSNSSLYSCALPCSGNWTQVDLSKYQVSVIEDIATDDTNLYILCETSPGTTVLLIGSGSKPSGFSQIPVPFSATRIFSTHTFIWAQDSANSKQRCAKPCTTASWTAVKDDASITITSSSSANLYGKTPAGVAMKTDETLNSGWSAMPGFAGKIMTGIFGQVDSAVYGVDTNNKTYRSDGTSADLVQTQGYTPSSISVDPVNHDVWMTSGESAPLGNVFHKLDTPDYSTIMSAVSPLDKTRDSIVDSTKTEFKEQTHLMTTNKLMDDFINFFKKMFNIGSDSKSKADDDIGKLQGDIHNIQIGIDQMQAYQPIVMTVIAALVCVSMTYLFLGVFLGEFTHYLAIVVFGISFGVSYYFFTSPNYMNVFNLLNNG